MFTLTKLAVFRKKVVFQLWEENSFTNKVLSKAELKQLKRSEKLKSNSERLL